MKVILDANIFISYLLAPRTTRTIPSIVEACFENPSIELVAPPELLEEIVENVRAKPYLRTHILQADLDELVEAIRMVATIPAPLADIPAVSPDPDDDYLLAYGLGESVNYLVTGDTAVLQLKEVDSLTIIDAPAFWHILRTG